MSVKTNASTTATLLKSAVVVALVVLLAMVAVLGQAGAEGPQPPQSVDYASGIHSAQPVPVGPGVQALPFGGVNVRVNQTTGGAQNETSIGINPNQPTNLVAGANDYRGGETACGFYASDDRGSTWTTDGTFGYVNTFSAAGDPGIAFDANGNAYYLCMNFTRNNPGNDATQYVHKSTSDGATWGPAVLAAGSPKANFDDKGHIAVDNISLTPHRGNIYVSFSRLNNNEIRFNRSVDGGASFTGCPGACADFAINDDTSNAVQGSNIAVGKDGDVYVAWAEWDGTDAFIQIDKSTDGGVNFGALSGGNDHTVRTFAPIGNPGGPGIRPINRVNSFPVIAASPTQADHIYAVWPENPSGADDSDIYFARSTDGGNTWGAPVRVNSDINPAGDFHSQFFAWMAVDPIDGSINVVWYDDRNDPDRTDGTPLVDLYFASSTDGGLTFGNNLRVSTQSSNVTTNFGTPFFGDYNAIDARNGIAFPFWTDSRTGDQDVFTTQVGGADLSITKSDSPDPVVAGEPLLYTITVYNAGPAAAFNVTVEDTLPTNVDYDTGPSFCTLAGNVLTCEVGNLAPNASTSFTIQVTPNADAAGASGSATLVNTATVSSDQEDPDTSDNTATETTIVREEADLAVDKDCKPDRDGTPFYAGETATCTITVTNLGASTARNVSLVDEHVSNGTFEFAGVNTTVGSCNATLNPQNGAGTVTCDLGDVDPGESVIVTVQLTADSAQDINDSATVSSDTPDPDTSNNQAKDSITVVASADLAITKTATPNPVVAGTQLTYDLEVTNNGPSTAVNVVIEDVLPAGVSIQSVSSSGGTCNAGVPGDASLPTTCTFDSLADGASETMQIVVMVHPSTLGVLGNNAEVYSDTYDPDNSNNLATTATTVDAEADLSVTKTDSPDPVLAGEMLTYDLTVANAGPSTAVDVMLTDVLPAEVTFQGYTVSNGTGTCVLQLPDTVECDLNDLSPGQFVTVAIDVLVDASVPDGTVITDTATVSAATADPDGSNNTATEDTTVLAEADLALAKDANFLSDNPSKRIVYTLTIVNHGPSDAQDVVLVDTLPLTPKKIVYVMDSGNGACLYEEGPHTVTCEFGTMGDGEVVSVDIIVDARGSVGRITNVADVYTTTIDPDLSNNHAEKEIRVKGGPGPK